MEKRNFNYSIAEIDEVSVIATKMMRQEVAAFGGINPPDITPGVVCNVVKIKICKPFQNYVNNLIIVFKHLRRSGYSYFSGVIPIDK